MKVIITRITLFLSFFSFLVACSLTNSSREPINAKYEPQQPRTKQEKIFSQFVVSSQNENTSRIAKEIYQKGGNIIDAAVAASFAISVERPQSTGIGGGGFLLFYSAKDKKTWAVDFRERAPLKSKEKMYLDEKGEVIKGRSLESASAAAVPGLVKGLYEVHRKWGKLKWSEVVQPSIVLAREGFKNYPHLASAIKDQKPVLERFLDSRKIFLKGGGEPLGVNDLIVQTDLAKTLEIIARKGESGFYSGEVAEKIIRSSNANGGIISAKDLKEYKTRWLEPIYLDAQGRRYVTMPPPSSALHVLQSLWSAEKLGLGNYKYQSPEHIIGLASIFQRAFADRAEYLGDSEFYNVPTAQLISEKYLGGFVEGMSVEKMRNSQEVLPGKIAQLSESLETTHISLMDAEGNAVATTQTINGRLGSGLVAEGTGILLNNTMDDFVSKPGVPNLFGAIGGRANSIQPKKTPLSSMSPTLVFETNNLEKPIMSVGSPGGTRIITCVAQTMINYFIFKRRLFESVSEMRIHHQWTPDHISLETPGPSTGILKSLDSKKVTYKVESVPCRVMAIARENDKFIGVTDPRDSGIVEGL